MRTNLARTTEKSIRENYGRVLKIYDTVIPVSIKAAETSAAAVYDKGGKVAKAYEEFAKEVVRDGEKERIKSQSSRCR
jgi:chromosome partitioning protein